MPFDADLVLADSTADWTKANLDSYGNPTSLDKNAGGFVVIDLKQTGAKGLAAVFIADQAGENTDDALTLVLQASDELDFVADSANDVHTLANFEVAGVTHGVILGNETPCTVIRRFATDKRYLRVAASATASDDFHTCHVLLAPWPFKYL